MRVLGMDPGIATVGFGVIDTERSSHKLISCGAIRTPANTSITSRLNSIFEDVGELLQKFSPDSMAVEELFFNTNATTGISVAQGRGVILLAAYRFGVPVYEYAPLQVKLAVTGYGRADKKQVIEMVQRLLAMKVPPKPDDAADALAVALCHARSSTSLINRNY